VLKSDLREKGYSEMLRNPKRSRINALWAVIALTLIAGTIVCAHMVIGEDVLERRDALVPLGDFIDTLASALFGSWGPFVTGIFYIGLLILSLFMYLFFKLIMTVLVCQDKRGSIKLKILTIGKMPVCHCKEALKVWQTVLIYFAPVIITYLLLFMLCVIADIYAICTVILIFMTFFMAFDLTVVIYALVYKIFDGIDYISVDFHLYELTFFHKPYMRFNKKAKKT